MLSWCINILLLYYQGWMIVNINGQNTEDLRGFFSHTLLSACTLLWCAHGLNESFPPALQSIWTTPWLICSRQSVAGRKTKGMKDYLWHSLTAHQLDIASAWLINFVLECYITLLTLIVCAWPMSMAMNSANSDIIQMFSVGTRAKGKAYKVISFAH